jgi:hypothetical protein
MKQLAVQEDALQQAEKQTQHDVFLTMQGQFAALVFILRSKGILLPEDVKTWEGLSERVTSLMKDLTQATLELQMVNSPEDVYLSTKKALVTSRTLCELFDGDIAAIDGQLQFLESEWQKHQEK